jgi:predicted CoA-binding protein
MFTDLSHLLAFPTTAIAVVGATDNLEKYGSIIYRDLKGRGYQVLAVNPVRDEVDGDPCYPSLHELPGRPDVIDFVVPPDVGLRVARTAVQLGLDNIWLQPGAESPELVGFLEASGLAYQYDACIMVRARYTLKSG